MRTSRSLFISMFTIGCLITFPRLLIGQTTPYKIIDSTRTLGTGAIDYVYADNDDRQLYIPRGNQILVFDLDTLRYISAIPVNGRAHGVAVDFKTGHGFCSSNPIFMWDTKTLKPIKTINVQGRPDGILFEPLTDHIYIFSHSSPNATVIDGREGTIVGTIELGGAPEQATSDGKGHLYVDIEDKDNVAVVDVNTLKVIAHYDLAGKGGEPAGLGLDVKNHILFVMCRNPQNCVILKADDGKILFTLPIGRGTDGGGFNSVTMEAFSSQGDGTLTVIKEKSPMEFEVEQTVQTKPKAKTCTLDTKNNRIILIAIEPVSSDNSAPLSGTTSPVTTQPAGGGHGYAGPGYLDIFAVGR